VDGGTSARTKAAAVTGLKTLSLSKKGIANNPIPLDAEGYVPKTYVPTSLLTTLNVVGSFYALANTSEEYVITDFDFRTQYTLSVIGNGTVSRTQDIITYNAPAQKTTGGDGFTLNGVQYFVSVGPSVAKPPRILTPVDLANNIPSTYTFTTSAFVSLGETQAHTSSTWQLATDIDFVEIVQFSNVDTVNKTSWTVSGLEPTTNYFVRVKHTGSVSGDSYWSPVVRFQTGEHIPTFLSQIIPAAVPAPLGLFGRSVSISDDGTVVAVGSPGNNGDTTAAFGRVFIYNKTEAGWTLVKTLRDTVTSNEYESRFGYTVKLNGAGTALLVGVRSYNNGKGAVVLFTKTNNVWNSSKRFYRSTLNVNSYFGDAVAMNSTATIVVIGAPGKTVNTVANAGAIYVYKKSGSTWDGGTLIEPNEVGANYNFGSTLDCDLAAGTFVTSSWYANSLDNNYGRSGIVYVYKYEGSAWVLKQSIEKPLPSDGLNFGYVVQMNSAGDTIAIADRQFFYETSKLSISGSVNIYTYVIDQWMLDSTFTVPSMSGYLNSFINVSITLAKNSDTVAINYKTTDSNNDSVAKIGIFRKIDDVWVLKSVLLRPAAITGSSNQGFYMVALTQTGDTCVVGADKDSYTYESLIQSGLAYIYQ